MRRAILGAAMLAVGALLIAIGVVPVEAAIDVWLRVWPILLFVMAITVVTELAAEAGLFRFIAEVAARHGRHRSWLLWLLVVVLAVASTIFLSLDTTAVLLTPVVILLARHVGISPLPFALTTVWLANSASLLLPVSNLTNLLAQHTLDNPSPLEFAALMAAPAIVAIVVPCVVLFVVFRRELLERFEPDEPTAIEDRVLFGASVVVIVVVIPLLVSGLPVWIPALAGALVLGGFFVVRRRSVLSFSLIPWQIVVLASGLFLLVEVAHSLGLGTVLAGIAGVGDDPLALLRLSATSAVGSNLIDNLPAYLALEPVAGSPDRMAALLVGTNAGALVTPWASLATLLWHERLVSLGVELSWKRYMLLGLIVVPLTVIPAALAIAL